MNKKTMRRFVSVFLAAMVFVSFQLPFVQTADAASKKKSVYVVTRVDSTYKDYWGSSKTTDTYTYYKSGLVKIWKNNDGKTKYKRNKAGLVSSLIWYNEKGKKGYCYKNTIAGGKITKSRDYNYVKGKKKLADTTKYTYDTSGGLISEEITHSAGNIITITYDSNGYIIGRIDNNPSGNSSVCKHSITLDKHGNFTKDVLKTENTFKGDPKVYKETCIQKNKYTYNKAGKITKVVTTFKYSDGSKSKQTEKFTYNKAGKITKSVFKDDDGIKSVTVYTYKKIKVSKKYRKLISKEQQEIVPVIEQNM